MENIVYAAGAVILLACVLIVASVALGFTVFLLWTILQHLSDERRLLNERENRFTIDTRKHYENFMDRCVTGSFDATVGISTRSASSEGYSEADAIAMANKYIDKALNPVNGTRAMEVSSREFIDEDGVV